MRRFLEFATLAIGALALASGLNASCPNLGVLHVECPVLGSYPAKGCDEATTETACSKGEKKPERHHWGTVYKPNHFVAIGHGPSELCYSSWDCKWDRDRMVCSRDDDSKVEHMKAINLQNSCDIYSGQ
jgi:hypothetical protein